MNDILKRVKPSLIIIPDNSISNTGLDSRLRACLLQAGE